MSTQPTACAVLSRTAAALHEALDLRWRPVELGRLIGRAHTVGHRDWGADPTAWRLDGFTRLLMADQPLRQTYIGGVQGDPEPVVPPGSVVPAARDLVRRMAREIDHLLERTDDGKLDQGEERLTEIELDDLAARITQLRALVKADRRRSR